MKNQTRLLSHLLYTGCLCYKYLAYDLINDDDDDDDDVHWTLFIYFAAKKSRIFSPKAKVKGLQSGKPFYPLFCLFSLDSKSLSQSDKTAKDGPLGN